MSVTFHIVGHRADWDDPTTCLNLNNRNAHDLLAWLGLPTEDLWGEIPAKELAAAAAAVCGTSRATTTLPLSSSSTRTVATASGAGTLATCDAVPPSCSSSPSQRARTASSPGPDGTAAPTGARRRTRGAHDVVHEQLACGHLERRA